MFVPPAHHILMAFDIGRAVGSCFVRVGELICLMCAEESFSTVHIRTDCWLLLSYVDEWFDKYFLGKF